MRRCAAGKQEAVYVALGMMKNVVFVAGVAGEYVGIVPYRWKKVFLKSNCHYFKVLFNHYLLNTLF